MPGEHPDEVWSLLVRAVIDSRSDWRRAVAERTGLPFSRLRVLRRLDRFGPLTLKQLAAAADIDPPAATVAVNDLVDRGYVRRTVALEDRRAKVVTITDSGRARVRAMLAVEDPAPAAIRSLPPRELARLADLARALGG
ncbi:transcriptional regulator [Tsukamurella pulmonis]|uniref:DNA-binding transcriptional regulator, MarR family n=1 Tax=Tsukamurella pulmonis TaxID=47312 RepID=A0A1H1F978_9ACTN|nr:MarR family transcriptional regulator [Tsukamurella pulmonis]KXO88679.1 MarR family transcriptional regulator [Tsukamurella pulmonis]KXP09192.1 MarR family transcriptional regulator [Tsukamurella pulmonis]SDQ97501.1 DNA-binding transcriptional regulator, MarR family [Tsukamurella pulmonis]SUP19867.1 homoprotocatechuate degradation operon regulator, HpaR [Tsukamurella pulmonis]BDD82532.1 transcriptional regulator [Tsukamurella pulmonis]